MKFIKESFNFLQENFTSKPKNKFVDKRGVRDEDKRDSIKKILGLAAGAVVVSTAFKGVEKATGYFKDDKLSSHKEIIPGVADESEGEELLNSQLSTPEQIEIKIENAKSVEKFIGYGSEVKLSPLVMKEIEQNWLDKFASDSGRANLEKGMTRMSSWLPAARAEFKKVFNNEFASRYGEMNRLFGEDLVFLALTESNGDVNAVSPAGAVGAYQFMKSTALEYGLKIGKKVDERKNPVKSARACAHFLKDLYVSSQGDWNMALPMYNGKFPGQYIARTRNFNNSVSDDQKKKINFEGYLEAMKLEIEQVHQDVRKDKNMPEPLKGKETEHRLRFQRENLPYGPKTMAIISAINGGLVDKNKLIAQRPKAHSVKRKA